METDEGVNEQLQPEDGGGDKDGDEIVRHLLTVRKSARRMQAAICAVRRGRGFLFHPLYQGMCRRHSHTSLHHTAMPTHTHTSWLPCRYVCGAIVKDEYPLHPASLARLSNSSFDGIDNAFAYLKFGFQFFNLVGAHRDR